MTKQEIAKHDAKAVFEAQPEIYKRWARKKVAEVCREVGKNRNKNRTRNPWKK